MPKRSKAPPPLNAQKYRGGPWSGRTHFGTSGPPPLRVEVAGDGEAPSPGHYEFAEKAGPISGENAIGWWYDWVPATPAEVAGEGESTPDGS